MGIEDRSTDYTDGLADGQHRRRKDDHPSIWQILGEFWRNIIPAIAVGCSLWSVLIATDQVKNIQEGREFAVSFNCITFQAILDEGDKVYPGFKETTIHRIEKDTNINDLINEDGDFDCEQILLNSQVFVDE
jgi:hypothetical protein